MFFQSCKIKLIMNIVLIMCPIPHLLTGYRFLHGYHLKLIRFSSSLSCLWDFSCAILQLNWTDDGRGFYSSIHKFISYNWVECNSWEI